MLRRLTTAVALAALMPLAAACQSDGDDAPATAEAGASVTAGAAAAASAGGSLVRVGLQTVAADLATQLSVDRAAIPADAQVSMELAASVCGVSVKVLSVPTGEQAACAAKTASAELGQLVRQQLAAAQPPSTP